MSSHTEPRNPDRKRRNLVAAGLIGATCLAVAGVAYGQGSGFTYDPSQLPETKGTVKQYTLTPRGDIDGLILADGTEVKVPPHLTAQVVFAVRPGDGVTIRGLKARALPLVSAATIRNDATGATVTDEGGPRGERDRPETLVTAKTATVLHGARGEANGVLLDSGMTVRLPPPEAARWEGLIQPGRPLSVRGIVSATLLGSVMEARAVGPSPEQLTYLAAPPRPPRPEKGPREARDERGPRRSAAPEVFAPPPPPSVPAAQP